MAVRLHKQNFPQWWIARIMACVSLTNYHSLINGKPKNFFATFPQYSSRGSSISIPYLTCLSWLWTHSVTLLLSNRTWKILWLLNILSEDLISLIFLLRMIALFSQLRPKNLLTPSCSSTLQCLMPQPSIALNIAYRLQDSIKDWTRAPLEYKLNVVKTSILDYHLSMEE